MWRALKVCFLYIGTVIGAGFASGREISLFFGDTAPLNVAFSAVFMAILEALFLIAGRVRALPDNTAVRTGVVIASFSSVTAMLAGGEYALFSVTGLHSLGVLMAVAAGWLVVSGIEKIKLANSLLIPLLIALLLAVYFKNGAPVFQGSFSIVKPLHYSGLDVLLGGIVISREGEKLKKSELAATCVFSALFIGGVLFVLQNIVLSDNLHSSMPVLVVAEKAGLKTAAGILIAIAIFTTLVSSLDVLTQYTVNAFGTFLQTASPEKKKRPFARFAEKFSSPRNKSLAVFSILLFCYPVSFFGFDLIVDSLYPFVGLCGIVMTGWTAFNLISFAVRGRHPSAKISAQCECPPCPQPQSSSSQSSLSSSPHSSQSQPSSSSSSSGLRRFSKGERRLSSSGSSRPLRYR